MEFLWGHPVYHWTHTRTHTQSINQTINQLIKQTTNQTLTSPPACTPLTSQFSLTRLPVLHRQDGVTSYPLCLQGKDIRSPC